MPFDLSSLTKISALLQDQDACKETGLLEIRVDSIQPDPNQPRKAFDDGVLAELAQSIQSVGLIHPPTVRTHGQAYMLISGERRWRAMRLLGKETIKVIVRDDLDVRATAHAQLVENIQNESLSSWEIYQAIVAELESDTTQVDLATALGKSKQWVESYAAVRKMPEAFVTALREGRIADISAMRHLCRLHANRPDVAMRLLASPEPITRGMITEATAAVPASRLQVEFDPPTTGISTTRTEVSASAKVGAPGEVGEEDAASIDTSRAVSNPKNPQALLVRIRANYEGASWVIDYTKQRIGPDGAPAVMLKGDGDVECYSPLGALTLQSIECL